MIHLFWKPLRYYAFDLSRKRKKQRWWTQRQLRNLDLMYIICLNYCALQTIVNGNDCEDFKKPCRCNFSGKQLQRPPWDALILWFFTMQESIRHMISHDAIAGHRGCRGESCRPSRPTMRWWKPRLTMMCDSRFDCHRNCKRSKHERLKGVILSKYLNHFVWFSFEAGSKVSVIGDRRLSIKWRQSPSSGWTLQRRLGRTILGCNNESVILAHRHSWKWFFERRNAPTFVSRMPPPASQEKILSTQVDLLAIENGKLSRELQQMESRHQSLSPAPRWAVFNTSVG